ncbi:Chitin synthesis regulation, Congo red resistance, RCR protein [Niveomyces insectorum RCEF 264]|uniref:Chitin synthesis regulation, Congo red resistance, RCR protein n=1 Tax=Niveomyces insectorum RCEF 264 TaxID=1081102 RepID=A0A167U227_9HYPO|nr:Chitin synthesis regulation, Congo red resistance, RCR protein [Niveomyces insectorum RCEF 264]
MAPLQGTTAAAGDLVRRYYSSCYNGGYCSNWHYWGRWVLTGVIIVVFILALVFLSFRARRRRGRPMYGTGWANNWGGGNRPQQEQPQPQYGGYAAPPPQYSQPAPPQYTGGTYNSNEGYYGHNTGTMNNDVPLQQPGNTYYPSRGVDDEYAPPEGPPPSKR